MSIIRKSGDLEVGSRVRVRETGQCGRIIKVVSSGAIVLLFPTKARPDGDRYFFLRCAIDPYTA